MSVVVYIHYALIRSGPLRLIHFRWKIKKKKFLYIPFIWSYDNPSLALCPHRPLPPPPPPPHPLSPPPPPHPFKKTTTTKKKTETGLIVMKSAISTSATSYKQHQLEWLCTIGDTPTVIYMRSSPLITFHPAVTKWQTPIEKALNSPGCLIIMQYLCSSLISLQQPESCQNDVIILSCC